MASILIRTLIIYVLLSFALKVMGKRQLGELEIGELVSTLLISEIASISIDDTNIPLLNAILPILLIFSLEIILSSLKNKSEKMKKLLEGDPVYIIYKGKLLQKALDDNRMSVNELLSEMRLQGIGDISEIRYAILEQNGKLAILKNGTDGNIAHTLIIDTVIQENNLKNLGYDEKWLQNELSKSRISQKNVFLMTVDDNRQTNIIKKDEK